MADIELVIKIPEEVYKSLQDNDYCGISNSDMYNAIVKGTPLPKGHGRLIDANELEEKLHRYSEAPYQYALTVFNESPTIIEADKAESEG